MNKIIQIKNLTKQLLQYSYEYYVLDSPTISDYEYDKKFDELKHLEDEANFWLSNSPTRKVQGEVLPYLTKVHHSVPMLSADKSTDIEDVKKFVNGKMVLVSYKLDGSTVVLKYNNHKLVQALSRGSGYDGEDITHTARMIKNLPETIPYEGYLEIRGEALIPWEYYNEMNKDGSLGHPRNVASGALRQLDANEAAKRNIHFYAFTLVNWKDVDIMPMKSASLNFLRFNGFDVVPFYCVPACDSKGETLCEMINRLDRKTYANPTDGWCVEFESLSYGEYLGSTEHHDRRLYALKPEVEFYKTKLLDIDWTLGRTGQLTPTAVFMPIEIDNTIIERASVHNVSILTKLDLHIGDTIEVYKANMIIPQVKRNVSADEREAAGKEPDYIAIPSTCPVCGGVAKLVRENDTTVLMCTNENCSGKLLGKLTHFVSKKGMNIDGLSERTLELLISTNLIKDFVDIYKLSNHRGKLVTLDGMGKKSVENMLNNVEKSREVKLENFICALGIPGIGSTASKTIAEHFGYSFPKFIEYVANEFDFTKLKDFGEVMNTNIHSYMRENFDMVEELASEMHFIKPEKNVVSESAFSGKNVCVTGKLINFTRDSINEKLTSLGAKPVGSVSKTTDYLICNEASSSSKYKKAAELGIPVITEDEFLKMIGE